MKTLAFSFCGLVTAGGIFMAGVRYGQNSVRNQMDFGKDVIDSWYGDESTSQKHEEAEIQRLKTQITELELQNSEGAPTGAN